MAHFTAAIQIAAITNAPRPERLSLIDGIYPVDKWMANSEAGFHCPPNYLMHESPRRTAVQTTLVSGMVPVMLGR
jgi:hypothetical protein